MPDYVATPISETLMNAVLNILDNCIGAENAISRKHLLVAVNIYTPCNDRNLRQAINYLRHRGELILSTGGIEGGYWIAATQQEVDEYFRIELIGRISDLQEQLVAMRERVHQRWPDELQPILL